MSATIRPCLRFDGKAMTGMIKLDMPALKAAFEGAGAAA